MKGLCILLLGTLALCSLPADLSAQGGVANSISPALASPSFFCPGNVSPSENRPAGPVYGAPNLYVGWLEHSRGTTWIINRQNGSSIAQSPLKGFSIGITEEIMPEDRFGLLISGSVFLSQRGAGTWYTSPASSTFDFEIPSYYWWSMDGLVRGRVSSNFDILAGFRWDHTSTRVKYSDNTDDDYILNLYVPLIGAQIHQAFANGELLFRILATPLVPGRLRYNFWTRTGFAEFGDFDVSKGSFIEILSDYRFRISPDLSMGGFVKWNSLRVNTGDRNLSGTTNEPISWTVDIRSWTIGGSLSLGFSSFF